MKTFKCIYYPVMAVLMALMITLGFVDANFGGSSLKIGSNAVVNAQTHISKLAGDPRDAYLNAVRDEIDYIKNYLDDYAAFIDGTVNDDGEYEVPIVTRDLRRVPTVTVQKVTLSEDAQKDGPKFGDGRYEVGKTINNIVVIIPGTVTAAASAYGDAVLMTAHYDSVPRANGAADNASSVAAMMENIRYIIEEEKSFKNDLVFVFTDAEEEGAYGALAFKHQFKGFGDVYSRIKLTANFDSMGAKGSLLMYQTSAKNSKLIGEYSKFAKSTFSSSVADFVYGMMSNFSDFEVFSSDMAGLNFANVGGSNVYHGQKDTIDNLDENLTKQQLDMMNKFYSHFGSYDLTKLSAKSSSVFFSYLDVFTVAYPVVVAMVIGGLILGLIVAIIFLNKKYKAFGWGKLGGGVAVSLLTILATLLSLFIAFFAIGLLLSLFGVVPLYSLTTITATNVGLIVSAMVLTLALMSAFNILFKKALNVKGADVVRGNAMLWAVIGAILSFALPSVSYLFAFGALLQLTVMLLTVIFKDKFRARFKIDIERLFLYVWPMVLIAPLMIPVINLASGLLSAVMLPLIMILFMLMAGTIIPYASYLKPVLDRLAKKLPDRTIRVERTFVERTEDKAKKGKFTEQTVTKVTNEKVKWNYLNRVGISIVCVLSAVSAMLFSSFGLGYADNYTSVSGGYRNTIYNDAIIYSWSRTDSGAAKHTIQVKDHMAYKFISPAVKGLKWDNDAKAYIKDYEGETNVISTSPDVSKSGSVFSFTVFDQTRSQVNLILEGVKGVAEFKFYGTGGEFTIDNSNRLDKVEFNLPYGFGNFTITMEGSTSTAITYSEHCWDENQMNNIVDYNELRSYYAGEKEYDYIRAGIVLKYTKTVA